MNKLQDGFWYPDSNTYEEFLQALESRVRFFHSVGGRVSDHAIDIMMYADTTKEEAAEIFKEALKGRKGFYWRMKGNIKALP